MSFSPREIRRRVLRRRRRVQFAKYLLVCLLLLVAALALRDAVEIEGKLSVYEKAALIQNTMLILVTAFFYAQLAVNDDNRELRERLREYEERRRARRKTLGDVLEGKYEPYE